MKKIKQWLPDNNLPGNTTIYKRWPHNLPGHAITSQQFIWPYHYLPHNLPGFTAGLTLATQYTWPHRYTLTLTTQYTTNNIIKQTKYKIDIYPFTATQRR